MAHDAKFKKDPLTDRKSQLDSQRNIPGKFPSNPFKDREPRQSSDEWYTPHKGKVKK